MKIRVRSHGHAKKAHGRALNVATFSHRTRSHGRAKKAHGHATLISSAPKRREFLNFRGFLTFTLPNTLGTPNLTTFTPPKTLENLTLDQLFQVPIHSFLFKHIILHFFIILFIFSTISSSFLHYSLHLILSILHL